MSNPPTIPIGVLSGHLGSGKTTRLRRLLKEPRFARTAVVVNEFGVIGIDHELLESVDDQTILLANGCVCCSARSGLEVALRGLWQRNCRDDPGIDRVIIETSGLADPLSVLSLFSPGGPLDRLFSRQRLVVTVDAGSGQRTIESDITAKQQVLYADSIKITKRDLCEPPPALLQLIGVMNPGADVDTSVAADIRFEDLFGEHTGADVLAGLGVAVSSGRAGHDHLEDVTAIGLVVDEPLPRELLSAFLEGLAVNAGSRLLRVKGIVNLAGSSRPVLVQGSSHQRAELSTLSSWPSADRRTRLSIIGRRLPERWPELLLRTLRYELAVRETAADSVLECKGGAQTR